MQQVIWNRTNSCILDIILHLGWLVAYWTLCYILVCDLRWSKEGSCALTVVNNLTNSDGFIFW